jgi:hypothetical protein
LSAYEFTSIPELTEEEKKSPYARFYYEPILPPAPEIVAAIQPGQQIDPSLALAPQDFLKLFIPGALKAYNGYCVLPDGTGFSVIHTRLPDITLEMEKWWNDWFRSNDYNYLNYKIWLPGLHFMYTDPVWEDLGWGHVNFQTVNPLEPLYSSTLPKEMNPDFLTAHGGSFTLVPDYIGKPYWATVLHYVTLGKQGEDIITCVWSGIHIHDGAPVRMIDKAEKVNPEHVRLFACHCAWESARKARLLPKLFAYSKTLTAN